MDKNQIGVVIEGLDKDDGFIRASALINALREILAPFRKVDRCFSLSGKPTFHFNIIAMNYQSPFSATLEEVRDDSAFDNRPRVTNEVSSIYRSVHDGTFAEGQEEYGLIESMVNITKLIGHQIKSARLQINGNDIEIDEEFRTKIDLALVREETCNSYIRGMLEYINIHEAKNVFRIYPDIGPAKVVCHFPENMIEPAIKAIGKYVEVRGKLIFKAVAKYAHSIIVEEIEIFEPDEQLPSIFELQGIAPDLTGDLSTDEFVRKVRDGQLS